MLAQGADACGFRGDVWTRARVGVVIEQEFGASYTPMRAFYSFGVCREALVSQVSLGQIVTFRIVPKSLFWKVLLMPLSVTPREEPLDNPTQNHLQNRRGS